MTADELANMIRRHDWQWQYADNYTVHTRGRDSWNAIAKALKQLPEGDARAIWEANAPKGRPFPC